VATSTLQLGNPGSVASVFAATIYQGNIDRQDKLWNTISTEPLQIRVFSFERE